MKTFPRPLTSSLRQAESPYGNMQPDGVRQKRKNVRPPAVPIKARQDTKRASGVNHWTAAFLASHNLCSLIPAWLGLACLSWAALPKVLPCLDFRIFGRSGLGG